MGAKLIVKDRLEVDVKIVNARMSGNLIVARVNKVEDKILIMKNKSKLAGTKYYIEYDLSYEDRKIQEEIHRWIKDTREKGITVKAGAKKVFVNNV